VIFPTRKTLQHHHYTSNLNQMLLEMDGLSRSRKNPFVLIATNFPGRLDAAVLRRVPNKFYFGLPNIQLRERIFQSLLKDEVLHPAVDPLLLASMTSRYTGSDIKSFCTRAAIICDEFVGDGPEKGKRLLTMATFKKALSAISPTATKAAIMSIKAFAKENHPAGIEMMQNFNAWELYAKREMLMAEGSLAEDAEVSEQHSSESGEESQGK
jgi:SpoVK/Ycf46/Vps4 family AAA+-type ATPase